MLAARSATIGLQINVLNASTSNEINAGFARERPDALFVAGDPFFTSRRVQIANLAARNRVPAAFANRDFVAVGGLMSYGTNIADSFRQVGVYVGGILKGTKPADLPVVQSTKFEFVINLQTATLLGIDVPPTLLANCRRGDRVRRREFIAGLGGAVAWPVALRAQRAERVRRIGVLLPAAADDPVYQVWVGAFLQGLALLGWAIGRNVRIDTRWAGANAADIRRHAAELAALAPDVILAHGSGLSDKDPTLAELLKPLGYTTGQFGKNHLGDRNEFLPTVHGFDEFFGNLYHLNAEDEPEHPDYPKNLQFRLRFGPRGVLRCTATLADTPGEDPRFGKWGKQSCTDTGPLTKKRMETVDQEFLAATVDFIDRANREKKPFFAWFNATRMHIWTRLAPEAQGKTGLGIYPDGMVEHDGQVGQLLKKLDDLDIANNTIVIYTTDNGAETFTWPDGGTTPFRGEKNTNWEGSYRVPALLRWPGLVAPRTEINAIVSAEDWVQTLMAAAGEPDIASKLLQGYSAGGKTFKVHLDGYDQRDLFAGRGPDKRLEFFYWTDDGNFAGLRYDQYKAVFMEQPAHGLEVWMQPLVTLRAPKIFNLRSDPFERAEHEAGDYDKWFIEHLFVLMPAQAIVGEHLATFQEFPPRQRPGTFSIDQAMEKLMNQNGNN